MGVIRSLPCVSVCMTDGYISTIHRVPDNSR